MLLFPKFLKYQRTAGYEKLAPEIPLIGHRMYTTMYFASFIVSLTGSKFSINTEYQRIVYIGWIYRSNVKVLKAVIIFITREMHMYCVFRAQRPYLEDSGICILLM